MEGGTYYMKRLFYNFQLTFPISNINNSVEMKHEHNPKMVQVVESKHN
jgi:hypothetical protein